MVYNTESRVDLAMPATDLLSTHVHTDLINTMKYIYSFKFAGRDMDDALC